MWKVIRNYWQSRQHIEVWAKHVSSEVWLLEGDFGWGLGIANSWHLWYHHIPIQYHLLVYNKNLLHGFPDCILLIVSLHNSCLRDLFKMQIMSPLCSKLYVADHLIGMKSKALQMSDKSLDALASGLPSVLASCQSSHAQSLPVTCEILLSHEGTKQSLNSEFLYLFSLLRTLFPPNIPNALFHTQISLGAVFPDRTI